MDWRRCDRSRAVRARERAACEKTRSPWARLIFFAALQLSDQSFEILGLAEILIDRGEAHIGDLVQARERLHHEFADHRRRNFILAHALQAANDAGDHAVDAFALDRPLAQRVGDGTFQLLTLERFAPIVLLDDDQLAQLHALERREASAALWTMASAPDRRIVLARPAVLHLGIVMSTKWATHSRSRLLVDGKSFAQDIDALRDTFFDYRIADIAVLGDGIDDL